MSRNPPGSTERTYTEPPAEAVPNCCSIVLLVKAPTGVVWRAKLFATAFQIWRAHCEGRYCPSVYAPASFAKVMSTGADAFVTVAAATAFQVVITVAGRKNAELIAVRLPWLTTLVPSVVLVEYHSPTDPVREVDGAVSRISWT